MSMTMLWPLLITTIGFTLGVAAVIFARLSAAIHESRARQLMARSRLNRPDRSAA